MFPHARNVSGVCPSWLRGLLSPPRPMTALDATGVVASSRSRAVPACHAWAGMVGSMDGGWMYEGGNR